MKSTEFGLCPWLNGNESNMAVWSRPLRKYRHICPEITSCLNCCCCFFFVVQWGKRWKGPSWERRRTRRIRRRKRTQEKASRRQRIPPQSRERWKRRERQKISRRRYVILLKWWIYVQQHFMHIDYFDYYWCWFTQVCVSWDRTSFCFKISAFVVYRQICIYILNGSIARTFIHSHSRTFAHCLPWQTGSFKKGHSDKGHHDIHKGEESEKNEEFFEEDGDEAYDEGKGETHMCPTLLAWENCCMGCEASLTSSYRSKLIYR